MNSLKFAIIGAGPGGLAMAIYLSRLGHSINLYARNESMVTNIRNYGIKAKGLIDGEWHFKKVTSNAKAAIEDVDIIIAVVPASAHGDIAHLIGPYLQDGQIIILSPGRTCGALEFRNVLNKQGIKKEVFVSETQTILHTCRLSADKTVDIIAMKKKVPIATYPNRDINFVYDRISEIFPQFQKSHNILETGLNNVGCILHPAPTLLNIGWIETSHTQFKHYYEGITPSVAAFLERMDAERCAVASALGINAISTQQWLYEAYGTQGKDLYEALQNNKEYATINAPSTLQHRYLTEDVPTGLVPISEFGSIVGVSTPAINMIIDLANLTLKKDFRVEGRNLQNLGIEANSTNDLIAIFK